MYNTDTNTGDSIYPRTSSIIEFNSVSSQLSGLEGVFGTSVSPIHRTSGHGHINITNANTADCRLKLRSDANRNIQGFDSELRKLPGFGQTFNAPAHGTSGYGQAFNAPANGASGYGQTFNGPANGASRYGQTFNGPANGASRYDQTFNGPANGASRYGQTFNGPAHGAPGYGQGTSSGTPSFDSRKGISFVDIFEEYDKDPSVQAMLDCQKFVETRYQSQTYSRTRKPHRPAEIRMNKSLSIGESRVGHKNKKTTGSRDPFSYDLTPSSNTDYDTAYKWSPQSNNNNTTTVDMDQDEDYDDHWF